MIGIYMILNKVNGKVYIGQSNNIDRRLYKHKYHLRKGNHPNNHLQSAWNKYGESNFLFLTVEECSVCSLDNAERYWINNCDATNSEKGYNMELGGTNGYTVSDETKQKISRKNSGKNNPFYGKTHSKESRAKMSLSRSGKNNPLHSSNISEEIRNQLRERVSATNNPQWGKSVIEEYGGMWFIKTMASTDISIRELCRCIGINKSTMYRYLKRRGTDWTSLKGGF